MINKILLKLCILTCLLGNSFVYSQTSSVMSFNIRYDNPNDKENWWGNRKQELVQLIEHYHADFVGIQEGLDHQLKYIQKHTTNYARIGVGRDDGISKGEFTAIYFDSTKFDLIRHETFWLSDQPDNVSIGWDASMERICTYGKFRDKESGQILNVFNAHFDHIGPIARKMSAQLIIQKIQEFNLGSEAIVVMGDFNSNPPSEPIKQFKNTLDDGLEIAKKVVLDTKGTFNGFKHLEAASRRIDYIFSKNIEIITYRHINDKRANGLCISDHLPILSKLSFINH